MTAPLDEVIERLEKFLRCYVDMGPDTLVASVQSNIPDRAANLSRADLSALLDYVKQFRWRPIEEAPLHQDVLVYREDAGIMLGRHTCLEAFGFPESETEGLSEDDLHENDWWAFGERGILRLSNDSCGDKSGLPTRYMPLPAPPHKGE